ncbi:hypothetical protein F8388_026818 [Cannabis sativa]|uniref:Uncharacterized protein n=1 Tax=Cannabis sativa TaxID=3483 RepID=A0A7J6H3T4_CANSA|nr:hypothetical protein F8388_026818 [Cannabis sativa]
MSFVIPSSSSMIPSTCFNQCKVFHLKANQTTCLSPCFTLFHGKHPFCIIENVHTIFREKPLSALRCNYQSNGEDIISFDYEDEEKEDIEDTGSPWEGAVIYKRNSSITHVEYCTTLERLGLGKLSTEVSKSRASVMGLRVTKAVKDYPFGTPVHISVDITRKKRKLRLDGIIKTVFTLGCSRCGEAAAESIFSDFSLLLTEEPVEEPETIDMSMIFGENKSKVFTGNGEDGEEEDDEASIDFEDRLYFPPKEKEIDISKHIRDLLHLEITINSVCDANCKGMCFNCGMNLNTSKCICSKEEVKTNSFGPLGNLKKQMQSNK